MIEKNDLTILITYEEIKSAINKMVSDIERTYEGQQIVFVCTTGSVFMFIADLIRELPNDVSVEFVQLKKNELNERYVSAQFSREITGKHVILLCDIINAGKTTKMVHKVIENENPADIKVITLIDREKNHQEFEIPYTASFNIDKDEFICGYGMNYNGHYANLKNIYIVKSSTIDADGKIKEKILSTTDLRSNETNKGK
ncbi:phosphoribosyltransferase [Spiroplasma endosymbiont of Labia minor]|uniref:phosphoribosyltransferase n=1 Tax=Spiroplasma endosymbiont of Labia minor TaxID=3066305 RepID=UPI0030CCE620